MVDMYGDVVADFEFCIAGLMFDRYVKGFVFRFGKATVSMSLTGGTSGGGLDLNRDGSGLDGGDDSWVGHINVLMR